MRTVPPPGFAELEAVADDEMLSYGFMRNALWRCPGQPGCAVIGTRVVLKRMVFISGGVAHTHTAVLVWRSTWSHSHFLGHHFSLAASLLMGFFNAKPASGGYPDRCEWAFGLAIGIILRRTPGYKATDEFLFCSISQSPTDLWLLLMWM